MGSFTDTKCLLPKLLTLNNCYESQVLLRVPRKDNIYSVDLKSVVPTRGLTCLIAKAIIDESNTWHRRLENINFKTMNKLVKGNLVKRVLVIKPHNKTPYELIRGRPPLINFLKPFWSPVTILNTKDHLGKFDRKADKGYFVRTKDNIVAGQTQKEKEPEQEYILIPLCTTDPLISQDESGKHDQDARISTPISTDGPSFDTAVPSTPINTAGPSVSTANKSEEQLFERFSPFKNAFTLPLVPNISSMDNINIFGYAYDDEDVEEEVDINNVISSYTVPDTSFTKFHKDHPEDQQTLQWRHNQGIDKRGRAEDVARFQVTPNTSHLNAMRENSYRYLKGQPKLSIWYLRDLPFDLEDFLIVTMLELVLTGNPQQEPKDPTLIKVKKELSVIVKNPVFHSKTKHIEIRHHFIRDSYEKKLIQVIKIHTDQNVADLLTKAFDASRMERAATTASSLEAEQDSGNIN
ncbi:retrovirus-related pol polyprotein from transposon TNT 1-94 [Tanacetum coccineum]